MSDKFATFARNSVEWRSQTGVYEDANEFPDIKRSGKLKPGEARKVKLDHLSYVLFDISAHAAEDFMNLSVKGPDGTFTSVGLFTRTGDAETGAVSSSSFASPDGTGEVGRSGGNYDRVTAMVANADAAVNGAGSKYKRDEPEVQGQADHRPLAGQLAGWASPSRSWTTRTHDSRADSMSTRAVEMPLARGSRTPGAESPANSSRSVPAAAAAIAARGVA